MINVKETKQFKAKQLWHQVPESHMAVYWVGILYTNGMEISIRDME